MSRTREDIFNDLRIHGKPAFHAAALELLCDLREQLARLNARIDEADRREAELQKRMTQRSPPRKVRK